MKVQTYMKIARYTNKNRQKSLQREGKLYYLIEIKEFMEENNLNALFFVIRYGNNG